MSVVAFDMSEFRKKAHQVGIFAEDQMPYAISRTLNDTMFRDTRPHIINRTWQSAFKVRNRGLARAAMRVEKSHKNERPWTAGVFDALGKADLEQHARGGERSTGGGRLAVPNLKRVKLHARGKRPWASQIKRNTPKRALRVTAQGIFVGSGGRLHLVYTYAASAKLEQRFDFYEDFARVSLKGIRVRFKSNIQKAINSAFR